MVNVSIYVPAPWILWDMFQLDDGLRLTRNQQKTIKKLGLSHLTSYDLLQYLLVKFPKRKVGSELSWCAKPAKQ
jgi:hypothetical protein